MSFREVRQGTAAERGLPKPETDMFSTIILWIHAVAGGLWIGASTCFVIAGLAVEPGGVEQRKFVGIAASTIERIGLTAASMLLASGMVNLIAVSMARRFIFSTQFAMVLSAKIVLFMAMALMLSRAMRTGALIRALLSKERADALPTAMKRMVRSHLAIVAMGAVALGLGLWLMGT